MSRSTLVTVVVLSFALLPELASAQGRSLDEPIAPIYAASYGVAGSTLETPRPDDFVVRASAVGRDRRAAGPIFREGFRLFPRSPMLRLAREAFDAGLDPELALALDDAQRDEALAESSDIHTQHLVGVVLGIPAAISGVLSVGFLFAGLFAQAECSTLLIVPICGTTIDERWMAASAITGGASLALVATALGLQIDAGSRRGGWRRRLEAGWPSVALTASTDGGTLRVGGSF